MPVFNSIHIDAELSYQAYDMSLIKLMFLMVQKSVGIVGYWL